MRGVAACGVRRAPGVVRGTDWAAIAEDASSTSTRPCAAEEMNALFMITPQTGKYASDGDVMRPAQITAHESRPTLSKRRTTPQRCLSETVDFC